jgi:hypothetical protein
MFKYRYIEVRQNKIMLFYQKKKIKWYYFNKIFNLLY